MSNTSGSNDPGNVIIDQTYARMKADKEASLESLKDPDNSDIDLHYSRLEAEKSSEYQKKYGSKGYSNGNYINATWYEAGNNTPRGTLFTDTIAELNRPSITTPGEFKYARYGQSITDLNLMTTEFDIGRVDDSHNAPMPLVGHIIMTRPNLNCSERNMRAIQSNPTMSAMYNDKNARLILSRMSNESNYIFMPLIYNKAKSLTLNDLSMEVVSVGQTFFGQHINYAMHNEAHKIPGTLSMSFRNDRYMSIFKMMLQWYMYIHNVTYTNEIMPTEYDQKHGILDYGASLYYIVTLPNYTDIVYWQKWAGVYPTKIPLSIFNYPDRAILEDTLDIDFSYGIASDPMDPSVLMDINVLNGHDSANLVTTNQWDVSTNTSGYDDTLNMALNGFTSNTGDTLGNWRVMPTSMEKPIAMGNSYSNRPFIVMRQGVDDNVYTGTDKFDQTRLPTTKYQLIWRKGWAKGVDFE